MVEVVGLLMKDSLGVQWKRDELTVGGQSYKLKVMP